MSHTTTEWVLLVLLLVVFTRALRIAWFLNEVTEQRNKTMRLLHHATIELGRRQKQAGEMSPAQEAAFEEMVREGEALLHSKEMA